MLLPLVVPERRKRSREETAGRFMGTYRISACLDYWCYLATALARDIL